MGTNVATQQNLAPAARNGNGAATIKDMLQGEAFKAAVGAALPQHLKPERFIRIAILAVSRTPKLQQCTQSSLLQCMMTLSQLGLEPDGRRAHLIPYGTDCQLIVDYKGLVELAYRTGSVSFIHADVVCEQDEFEYDRGALVKHKIDFRKDRGKIYAAYALVRFKDGTEKCEVMGKDDIEGIRKRSKARDNGPWKTDWSEMAKKTAFRRLSKWIELSPEIREAVEADDSQFEHRVAAAAERVVTFDELSQLPTGDSGENQEADPA